MTPDNVSPVPGWPSYCVAPTGRVFGCRGELRQKVDDRGYHWVTLRSGRRSWCVKVGRLVVEAFIGPKPPGQVVRHMDDDRSNNALENLRYGTVADNAADARRNGRLCEGERHGRSVYTADQIRSVKRLRLEGRTYGEIVGLTGVLRPTVVQVCAGRQWGCVA